MSSKAVHVLAEIVESIFSTMLDLKVSPAEVSLPPHADRLTASVFLEGSWNGAVSIECSRQVACSFAGRLLAMDPPEAVNDEVRDAFGELANMIAGNVKSAIAADSRISMPSVVDGSDFELRICGSETRERLAFQSEDGHFWIAILAKDGHRAPNFMKEAGN